MTRPSEGFVRIENLSYVILSTHAQKELFRQCNAPFCICRTTRCIHVIFPEEPQEVHVAFV